MAYESKIISRQRIRDNICLLRIEKPRGYRFEPGQAAYLSFSSENMNPFTIVSHISDNFLEFFIKTYHNKASITDRIHNDDDKEIYISEAFGTLTYRGFGTFIAGGTGMTPFISILRNLDVDETGKSAIIISAKRKNDLLHEGIKTDKVNVTLTQENVIGYRKGRIDREFILENLILNRPVYLCGPLGFVVSVKKILDELSVRPEDVFIETG